jgi:hypothetical protein
VPPAKKPEFGDQALAAADPVNVAAGVDAAGALRLTDPALLRKPQTVSLEEAQQSSNFIVFRPEWLPPDCRLETSTFRPEQSPGRPGGVTAAELGQTPWSEANPCSVRSLIVGDRRQLRLKQFLYDWAPPAAGIAPLWDDAAATGFTCGPGVGWLGTDYRNAFGACLQRERTQLELSTLDGVFSAGELQDILAGLRFADETAASGLRATGLHDLNYWIRYRMRPYQVPYGLWKYPHRRPYDENARSAASAVVAHPLLAVDSAVEFFDDSGTFEAETTYHLTGVGVGQAWAVRTRSEGHRAVPLPPEAESHPALVRRSVDGLRAGRTWVACLSAEYGPWEALWEEEDSVFGLWMPPVIGWREDDFLGLLESLEVSG